MCRHEAGAGRLADHDLEVMLARAAEAGAHQALSEVALGGKDAVPTIHDMRSLLECIQFVRLNRRADRRAGHHQRAAPIALLVGIATKLRWFGPSP